jgi:hypothetical protein
LRAEPDDEEGAIKVYLDRDKDLSEGKYRLLREEKDRNVILCYYNAEELNKLAFSHVEEIVGEEKIIYYTGSIFTDFTCEDNKEYKYLL